MRSLHSALISWPLPALLATGAVLAACSKDPVAAEAQSGTSVQQKAAPPVATTASDPAAADSEPAAAEPPASATASAKSPPAASEPVPTPAPTPAAQPASKATATGAPKKKNTAAAKEALKVYSTRCAVCHGGRGKGDGPGAAALNPKPRSFSAPGWQKSVTNAHIEKVIVDGGPAVGMNAAMPPAPDLKSKPELLKALVQLVRALGKG